MKDGGEDMTGPVNREETGGRADAAIAGACAGLISRFVIAPLDVLKIRLQLQSRLPEGPGAEVMGRRGIQSLVRQILADEGIRGFWKGNIPAELLYLMYGSIQFTSYRRSVQLLKTTCGDLPWNGNHFVAGGVAGAVATACTYPLDLLRTRFAATGKVKVYDSILHSMKLIAQTEGVKGYYRGLGPALYQIIPHMGLFFGTYETLKNATRRSNASSGWVEATSGVVAGVVSKSGVYPLDTIRKRLQLQGHTRTRYAEPRIPVYTSAIDCAHKVIAADGLRGLYRGLSVSLFKAAPASAVTMYTFEETMRFLSWRRSGR